MIWKEKTVPDHNLFSYTYPTFPFINHHWGSEVIFYLTDKVFSVNGLILLKTIVVISSITLLLFYTLVRTHPVAFLMSSFLTLHLFLERTEIRPEIFGYLFFSFFLLILYLEREKEGKLVWFLPIISLLWVNIHISFVFTFGLFLLFLCDRMLLGKWKKRYGVIGILIFCASLFTPFGLSGALYPFFILRQYGYSIVENQSPFFLETVMNDPSILYFKITLLFLVVISPMLIIRKMYFLFASMLLFAGISLFAVRHFPFFALSLLFPCALGCSFLMSKTQKKVRIGIAIVLVVGISISLFELISNTYYLKRYSSVRTGFGQVKGMRDAVDFFLKENLSGPIFNNFDSGSYLTYRLYPKERVFVDGRPEAYPVPFFTDMYIPMQEKKDIWQKIDSMYGFKAIIFSHTDATSWGRQFLRRIVRDREWKLVFFDDYGILLIKDGKEHTDTVSQLHQMGNTSLYKMNSPDEIGRLIHVFDTVGFTDLVYLGEIKIKQRK